MLTQTEENYLKSIFKIAEKEKKTVSTNSISRMMETSPASVTDMIKKLADKELVYYEKYKGVALTSSGNKAAIHLIRKHRLWEVFLVNKLRFAWHQVHDIAEELEHISSEEMISRLDAYLDYPRYDPHGDPIPNSEGRFTIRNQINLSEVSIYQSVTVLGVRDHPSEFLKYLSSINIRIGSEIKVLDLIPYDKSIRIMIDGKWEHTISQSTSQLLLVKIN